jgi:hypothetical protein
MHFPVGPEDVKLVQGHSGKGLQVVCSCGTINWNHLQMPISLWTCRNCKRVLSEHFPGLVEKFLKLQKSEVAAPVEAAAP